MSIPDGGRSWISIRYEKLQNFCYNCGKIGHDFRVCKMEKLMSIVNNCEGRYGSWTTTSQCRSPEELIVAVKDSWEETAYYRRKKEEAIARKLKEYEQRMAKEAKEEEEDLFSIKLVSSSKKRVDREARFQKVEGATPNLVGEATTNFFSWSVNNRLGKEVEQDVTPADVVTKVRSRVAEELLNTGNLGSSAVHMASGSNNVSAVPLEDCSGNLLAIVPYCGVTLKEVTSSLRDLGLKRGAEEELERPKQKRSRLTEVNSNCLVNAISDYAGNLRKTKARLKRQGKRKGRLERENIPMEILEWEEEMADSVSPNGNEHGFVFKAKGSKRKGVEAVGDGGWPLTATGPP